jgi:hypothetical protein
MAAAQYRPSWECVYGTARFPWRRAQLDRMCSQLWHGTFAIVVIPHIPLSGHYFDKCTHYVMIHYYSQRQLNFIVLCSRVAVFLALSQR